MRTRSTATALALGLGLGLLGAVPATAGGTSGVEQPLTQREDDVPHVGVDDSALRAKLDTLAQTQSETQVEAILDSGLPVQALYEVEADEYVAAFVDTPEIVSRAIFSAVPAAPPETRAS